MANLITTSVTWEGKQTVDYFIKPLFIGKDPRMQGFKIMPNVQSNKKLNYFSSFSKQTRAYAKGFSGANASTYTQRTLTVVQLENEAAQDANLFYETVFEQVQNKGYAWNDVSGTEIENIVLALYRDGISADISRLFWLADTEAETLTSTTYGTATGTADKRYNMFDGMWKYMFNNAATTPTADQIKLIDLNSTTYLTTAAVKQVATITVTGTSGTANIKIDGVDYLATFDTDIETTIDNFLTAYAATLLTRSLVLTDTASTIIVTSEIAGRPFAAPTITNATGDLDGSVAATTANVAPSDLKADGGIAALKAIYNAQPAVLKQFEAAQKVFHVDWNTYENYMSTLEEDGKYTDMAKVMIQDGVERLAYRGIQIIPHQWDEYLDDTPHATGTNPARSTRILLTVPDNLVLGVDGSGDDTMMEFWYNQDEQENRMRTQWRMGVQYVHPKLIVLGY